MVPVLSRSREFSLFLDGTGTGTGKKWSRKKVPVPVPEKIGPGKKYWSRYRKKFWVPSHSALCQLKGELNIDREYFMGDFY